MPTTEKILRVLIVDDNRDGADALGLVVEALGHQVHVTYGGSQALDVATAFRPELMLIDLAMPDMDGCDLVKRFRQLPAFAVTKCIAITGHVDPGHITLAKKAGFNAVLSKPVALKDLEAVLGSVAIEPADQSPTVADRSTGLGTELRLSIAEARRIRNERKSKTLTQMECQAAVCEGIGHFQEEYLGWRSEQIRSHFVEGLLIIRIEGTLTLAERQLSKSVSAASGRDLIKQARKQLLELARPMLASLVHEVVGVKVLSMHHDISTVTGEEMVVFSLVESPRFRKAQLS